MEAAVVYEYVTVSVVVSFYAVVFVKISSVDGVWSRLAVRRSAGVARHVPLQFGRGFGDVDAERTVRYRVAGPVHIDHVDARLRRVVAAVDRAVLVGMTIHLDIERTCRAQTHA